MIPDVEPRAHTARNPDRETRGHQVAALARAKGQELMPWQRLAVDVGLELDPATGLPWFDTVVVTVQRQAGKTKLMGDVADHCCLTKPRARVWFTQQTGKHASTWMREEHFANLAQAAHLLGEEGTAACRYRLSRRAGAEGVIWKRNGSTFYAFPPNRDAMHSKQSDKTFVDEAWAHGAEAGRELRQAIRPTMNTRPGAQLWIVSAAGDANSAYLDEYLALGRLGLHDPTSRVCLIDYGMADDADPQDFDAVLAAHPAHGHTITRHAIEAAYVDFKDDPAGWARAYANRPTRARDSVWPPAIWTEQGGAQPELPERAGLAFDVTPMGDSAALGAAWRDSSGEAYLELIDQPSPRELPAQLVALSHARGVPIDYDPRSLGCLSVVDAVGQLVARDRLRDVELRAVPQNAYAAACVGLSREVLTRRVHHSHQSPLTEATEAATTTPYADGGFGWARKRSSGSIAPLVAVTLALRAFDTLPAPRRRAVASAGRR